MQMRQKAPFKSRLHVNEIIYIYIYIHIKTQIQNTDKECNWH